MFFHGCSCFFHGIVTVMDFKAFSWDLPLDFQWDVHVLFFSFNMFFHGIENCDLHYLFK